MKRGKSNRELQQDIEDMDNDLDSLRWDIEDKLDEIKSLREELKELQDEIRECDEPEYEFVNDTYVYHPSQLKLFV